MDYIATAAIIVFVILCWKEENLSKRRGYLAAIAAVSIVSSIL